MTTHTASLFSIATGSAEPIYRQLVEQVRRLAAQALALNPMTVSKAYGLLEMEGVLARRRGLGMIVAESGRRGQPAERAALLRPTLERAALEARQLELDPTTVLELFATILKDGR
jgi:GntR family transcriptional regulator